MITDEEASGRFAASRKLQLRFVGRYCRSHIADVSATLQSYVEQHLRYDKRSVRIGA